MQRDNGSPAAACASCRHQRKKCTENCVLAPYLSLEKNKEFQAVHKVFGVSNVAKMVKNLHVEDRERAVDSLVWEATCRQNDPILGSFGEFTRVSQELHKYRTLYWNNFHASGNIINTNMSVALVPANSNAYPGYGYQTLQSSGTILRGGEISYNYPYVQHTDQGLKEEESNKSALILPLQYRVQNNEDIKDVMSNHVSVILPRGYIMSGINQPYNEHLPGEYGQSTENSAEAKP